MTGTYDVQAAVGALARSARGRVGSDATARALYAVDASNYRVVPDAVVVPLDEEDLVVALGVAREHGAPVALRGGGTSMAGNCLGGIVIDVSRHLNKILDLDPAAGLAVVQPGVVLTDLLAAARPHRLAFGADPSSASRATLGGMIANNACGGHSVAWGTTSVNVRALDVVLADGRRAEFAVPGFGPVASGPGTADLVTRLSGLGEANRLLVQRRFGQFSRQISGYAAQHLIADGGPDIARLLCGSEGTLATTLQATVNLVRVPEAVALLVLGFPDAIAAADSVPIVLPHGPLTMESVDARLLELLPDDLRRSAHAAGLPEGGMWLLVEVGADSSESAAAQAGWIAEAVRDGIPGSTATVVSDRAAQGVLWRCRRDAAGLVTRRPDGAEAWGGWEDAAVPPARLGEYLRRLEELLGRFGFSGLTYGHFGEGCMHIRIDFDLLTAAGVARYREFVEAATDLVVSLGGSISGEHGDGRARSALLTRMYGADGVALLGQVKRAFDPDGLLNPGVIVDPPPLDAGLRHLGAARSRSVTTIFDYPDDDGNFAAAARRCVGVGKCRQSSGGVMCPSYQATDEEVHSTRGRAHLLWEMLEGEVVTGGWRSPEVADALELCLSCKGCLSDCPVGVDMATYKAEFTHHHYAGRPWARPRSHWSMGWLPVTARAAPVVNRLVASPARPVVARLGGIAPERQFPAFARESFEAWFGRRPRRESGTPVLLWPDTFTNFLAPQVGRAAVVVLEDAGFEVRLPTSAVCCGLTWISTGQLTTARRVLRTSLRRIAPALEAGAPVIGLEPSCTAALRHDAPRLLPGDPLAQRAATQVHTLAEALAASAPQWRPPQVGGGALVQTHCHQHAVLGFDPDRALLAAAGVDADIPDSGCCGLAGNFGFEAGHYAISQRIGERVLLPAVRAASPATAIVADGFSCRTQIAQGSGRVAVHVAELLAAAIE
ncbi:MAG: FAD-binding and (Fe-S)-binding domain-containing protein [Tetrasphaera sp.]